MNTRLIIALLVTVIMIFVYQLLFVKKQQQESPSGKEGVVAEKSVEKAEPEDVSPQFPVEQRGPKEGATYQDVVVDTPLYTATFSTYGGRLKSWKLKQYMDKVPMHPLGKFVQNMVGGILGRKNVEETPPLPVDIVNTADLEDKPLGIKFKKGRIGYDEGIPFIPSSKGVTLTGNGEEKTLTLRWRSPGGEQIDKQFTFYADNYRMEMEVIVSIPPNRDSVNDTLELEWTSGVPEAKKRYGGFFGPIYYAAGDYHTIKK
jgi:YidC/Oxa1 family membrane protein insertase